MQRIVIPILVAAAVALAGCSSSNKHNNAASASPASASLAPLGATPIAAQTPIGVSGTPVPLGTAPVIRTPAAGTPSAASAASPTAASASATTQPAPAAASTSAPAATATASGTQAPAAAASASAAPASTAQPSATSASGGSSDALTLINQIKPGAGDLPSGYSPGQFAGEQPNAQAITGYANPSDVLSLFTSSGRQDGFVQQIAGPNGETFGVSYGVWQDAAGAKQFMDNHPLPDSSVTFQQVQLDQPLGDQYQALQIGSGASSSYALSWRVGRVVLGLGGAAGADGKPSADLLQLANLLTQRAQAAQQ